jgi:hypothetical protein
MREHARVRAVRACVCVYLGSGRGTRIDREGGRAIPLGVMLALEMGHVSAHRAHLALSLLVCARGHDVDEVAVGESKVSHEERGRERERGI